MSTPLVTRQVAARRAPTAYGRHVARSSRSVMKPVASTSWKVVIHSRTPYENDPKSNITIQFVDKDTGKESPAVTINDWKVKLWSEATELLPGRIREGEVVVPPDFGTPGAIVMTKAPCTANGSYIVSVKLSKGSEELVFPCLSWVWDDKKPRVFFHGAALPKDTPDGLKAWREKELVALRGTKEENQKERKEGERIYEYDLYTDLGHDEAYGQRKVLGGHSFLNLKHNHPFPRRLRTGRKKLADGVSEYRDPSKKAVWWLPPDDKFSFTKDTGFNKGLYLNLVPAIGSRIKDKLGDKNFASFKEVYSLLDSEGKGLTAMLPKELPFYTPPPKGTPVQDVGQLLKLDDAEVAAVDSSINQTVQNLTSQLKVMDSIKGAGGALLNKARDVVEKVTETRVGKLKDFQVLFKGVDDVSDILKFSVPKVFNNRWDAWHTDEEFGRQTFAGVNPNWVKAVKKLPKDSAIKEETIKDLLGAGETLDGLLALTKPRLFLLDFVPVVEEFLDTKYATGDDRAMHAGRCLLYKRADGHIVPIAIELKTTKKGPYHVYTPKSPGPVWLLAKTIVNNIDSFVHQGYTHYGRCHAFTEPYIISMARHLSAAHPVYQLLRPHFRYTLQINQNARKTLVQANGVVEQLWTPGYKTMELVSEVYGAIWRFDHEGLPEDLKARGLMDEAGNILVDDYPYAEDGMLLWNAYKKWFTEYLTLYYHKEADIKQDAELQAWWSEIKSKGHPDINRGWPSLNSVDDLVFILNSITWVTSGLHTAVNFTQYDNTGFCLNKPSCIRKHMPAPGTPEYETLANAKGAEFEKLYLSYLPTRNQAATLATTMKLLSNHAIDEEYVGQGEHEFIKSGPALEAYKRFGAEIKNIEATIIARNASDKSLSRNPAKGGLPYTVLIPSSGPGVTMRGVPNSVSI